MKYAQLLSSYGADRQTQGNAAGPTAVEYALSRGHDVLADWLECSDGWTPMHHVGVLTAERTRTLLRDGGSIHKLAGTPPLSPQMNARSKPGSEEAQLILAAGQPW